MNANQEDVLNLSHALLPQIGDPSPVSEFMGGAGYCREYPVERLWRDAKLLEIGGGTLEAHQKNLAKDLARMGSGRG
jgi:hypothetical protein